MNTEVLRKIGLTEGEIKVYLALASLGKSSTGAIIDKSKISSSKVYLILERLTEKGLVSFIVENNIKIFQATNPKNITHYIEKKQKDLEKTKQESESFIVELSKSLGKYEEESAQIYRGFAGLRVAFDNLLEEIGSNGEFLFFSQSREELENQKVVDFFKKLHQKRVESKILTRGIISPDLKDFFKKNFGAQKKYSIRLSNLNLPMAVSVGKNRVLLNIWGEHPICFEVVSKRIAKKYKDYFNEVWKVAKK